MTTATIQTTEVLLQASIEGDHDDPDFDSSEPLEAVTRLPIVPRKDDVLCVWLEESAWGRREAFLTVTQVAFCTYAPERIVVSVSTDGHGIGALKRIFEAVEKNEQP